MLFPRYLPIVIRISCCLNARTKARLQINFKLQQLLSLPSLQLKLLGNLDALSQRSHPRVNRIPFSLQLLTLGKQVSQRHGEDLDELAVLELRLRVLVRRQAHVDADMDHLQVGVAEPGVC
jgi:hypothetical protein